jgi:hypothetical protein
VEDVCLCLQNHIFDISLFLFALAVVLLLYSNGGVTCHKTAHETLRELSPCTVNEGRQMALTAVVNTMCKSLIIDI